MPIDLSAHTILRQVALRVPRLRRLYDHVNVVAQERDNLAAAFATLETALARAERDRTDLRQALTRAEQERAELQEAVTCAEQERYRLCDEMLEAGATVPPQHRDATLARAAGRLIERIASGADLDSRGVQYLAAAVELHLLDPRANKLPIHRDIAKAIFARSAELYCHQSLPDCLVRFTYPALLAILLNTHCNAACFFCREADYQGTSVEYSEVQKLDTAIRHARVVDLTGWGEPFLYPNFERVVQHIMSINQSPQLLQVTTNGSLLSKRWGDLLSGHINFLVVSLNAATPATYEAQMRYKSKQFTFERILSNLRDFLPRLTDEDRKRIDFHMVANTDNYTEISKLVELASSLGVPAVSVGNYISAQRQYMDKTLWNVKQEYNDEFARARELGARLGVTVSGRQFFVEERKQMGAANCMAPFEQFFIEPSGKTAPCCFMGNERIENVYRDGFEAVWFSDVMNRLRVARSLPPCQICTVFSPFDDQTSHISATLLTERTASVA
jgi:MoaA/NifB/PqqE/SkfB family radical SAM enzyme